MEVVEEAVGDVARRREPDAVRHRRHDADLCVGVVARAGDAVEGGADASAQRIVEVGAHAVQAAGSMRTSTSTGG